MTTAQAIDHGMAPALHIGQHVRGRDFDGRRVTGVVVGLFIDSDRVLQADLVLDEPIVIPALAPDDHEVRIHRQATPAYELQPFDDREELIAGMRRLLERMRDDYEDNPSVGLQLYIDDIRAQIAKATGGAA